MCTRYVYDLSISKGNSHLRDDRIFTFKARDFRLRRNFSTLFCRMSEVLNQACFSLCLKKENYSFNILTQDVANISIFGFKKMVEDDLEGKGYWSNLKLKIKLTITTIRCQYLIVLVWANLERCSCIQGRLGIAKQHQYSWLGGACTGCSEQEYPLWMCDKFTVCLLSSLRIERLTLRNRIFVVCSSNHLFIHFLNFLIQNHFDYRQNDTNN